MWIEINALSFIYLHNYYYFGNKWFVQDSCTYKSDVNENNLIWRIYIYIYKQKSVFINFEKIR